MIKEGRGAKQPIFGRDALSCDLVANAKSFVSSAALIWLALLFYRTDPYYKGFLYHQTQQDLLYLALAYSIGGFIFYAYSSLKQRTYTSRGLVIVSGLYRLARAYLKYLAVFPTHAKTPLPKPSEPERVSILFAIVKLFFLPLMLNFGIDNYHTFKAGYDSLHSGIGLMTATGFNYYIYPTLFALFLLVDTSFFIFGYSLESGLLKNKVRSVEPTFFGWAVALIAYPPFNGLLGNYVLWYANDDAYFSSSKITVIVRIFILLLMGTYASASVALGSKASNLTNRGIVGWGPYRWVRHPAYITKNLAWWITIIPVFSLAAFIGMFVWSTVYFLRAITEERHLIRDPDYQAYCKKVRYRFIPGVV